MPHCLIVEYMNFVTGDNFVCSKHLCIAVFVLLYMCNLATAGS